jgi:hypothetical protein
MTTITPLRPIVVHFADAEASPTFAGYTNGRLWNGAECPQLPLAELRRLLALLVEWGEERSFEILGEHEVRVFGKGVGEDYTMSAKRVATTDGDLWLFDCGNKGWTFSEVAAS